jgi:hypothetical protein
VPPSKSMTSLQNLDPELYQKTSIKIKKYKKNKKCQLLKTSKTPVTFMHVINKLCVM